MYDFEMMIGEADPILPYRHFTFEAVCFDSLPDHF